MAYTQSINRVHSVGIQQQTTRTYIHYVVVESSCVKQYLSKEIRDR